ncbi:MAG: endolytic transglycosylase MltG [Bacteroidia bacterium]
MRTGRSFYRLFSLAVLAVVGVVGYWAYINLYKPNVNLEGKNYKYIYIKTGAGYDDVLEALYDENVIDNHKTFEWMATRLDLDKNIHPGRFRISNGMNNRQIINMLRNNRQEKVKLTFNSQIHNLEELTEYIDAKLELSADEVEEVLGNDGLLEKKYGLDPDNVFALFLPNVYEVSWAIGRNELFDQIKEKFDEVWNKQRIEKAKKTGFSIPQLMTLASIVQGESGIESEQEKIAGVYINRLKKDIPLQADPTLKFANRNYDAQRITNADKDVDSPYNTYRNKGLPPGPISLVYTQSIDAVLNYSKHNFIFFCAKPDFSGFSDFTCTYKEHEKFAEAYQKALDKKGIRR